MQNTRASQPEFARGQITRQHQYRNLTQASAVEYDPQCSNEPAFRSWELRLRQLCACHALSIGGEHTF